MLLGALVKAALFVTIVNTDIRVVSVFVNTFLLTLHQLSPSVQVKSGYYVNLSKKTLLQMRTVLQV